MAEDTWSYIPASIALNDELQRTVTKDLWIKTIETALRVAYFEGFSRALSSQAEVFKEEFAMAKKRIDEIKKGIA